MSAGGQAAFHEARLFRRSTGAPLLFGEGRSTLAARQGNASEWLSTSAQLKSHPLDASDFERQGGPAFAEKRRRWTDEKAAPLECCLAPADIQAELKHNTNAIFKCLSAFQGDANPPH